MGYYTPCKELEECDRLISEYYKPGGYEKCFEGHLLLAEKGYPLAECQVGFFYHEGLGVEKNDERAFYWTERAAEHGDRDGQCNLAWFYEEGIGTAVDLEQARKWYLLAAKQDHDLAISKCREWNMELIETE